MLAAATAVQSSGKNTWRLLHQREYLMRSFSFNLFWLVDKFVKLSKFLSHPSLDRWFLIFHLHFDAFIVFLLHIFVEIPCLFVCFISAWIWQFFHFYPSWHLREAQSSLQILVTKILLFKKKIKNQGDHLGELTLGDEVPDGGGDGFLRPLEGNGVGVVEPGVEACESRHLRYPRPHLAASHHADLLHRRGRHARLLFLSRRFSLRSIRYLWDFQDNLDFKYLQHLFSSGRSVIKQAKFYRAINNCKTAR